MCRGVGQVRRQQGFFTLATTCPQCRGNGQVITKPCPTCHGAGRVQRERKITVKIPPGIATGQQLRLQGEGEAGSANGPAGHLYVVVHVHEHEFFRRDGNNLFCEVAVNFTTVALGGEILVPTLDGSETVKVPEGTQTGTTLRLRGKGMPDVSGRGRGDLFATVQVQTPKKLTKEQRRLVEELAKVLPKEKFEPRARDDEQDERNLFDRVKDMFG
jgi:molecular chaperone DnaJ